MERDTQRADIVEENELRRSHLSYPQKPSNDDEQRKACNMPQVKTDFVLTLI
jgi:hypothetical protein